MDKLLDKKVFISGNFNVLHPGHLRLLRFAHEVGNYLIVGVQSDRMAGSAAYVSEENRLDCVRCNTWVDEAFLIDEPVNNVIKQLQPDFVLKGKEHEANYNQEQVAIDSYGGKLIFGSGESTFSSIDILRREFYETNLRTIYKDGDFLKRHNITSKRLKKLIQQFKTLKVCVIGDLIVDEYITCQPLGMSQEDPTIVVTPIDSTRFIGGAGIVAAHGAVMGADVFFITVAGNDATQEFAQTTLSNIQVKAQILVDETRPTTLKQRFRSKGKTLLRVSHLKQSAINTRLQFQFIQNVETILKHIDLLIFSDFNYGCLPQSVVNQVISLAKKKGIMMIADCQSSSQVGDISRYQGMHLITPTEHEARLSIRNNDDGLVVLTEKLRLQATADNVILKLGEEGLLIHAAKTEEWLTDKIPALNTSPKDVAGAGDSLLMISALSLSAGGTIWEAGYLGSLAAAIQVGRVGNTPVKLNELLKELD